MAESKHRKKQVLLCCKTEIYFVEKLKNDHIVKTVDHLATKCDRMVGHDYTRRHNEVVKFLLCKKYGLKNSKKVRAHSVQEIVSNNLAEIRVI